MREIKFRVWDSDLEQFDYWEPFDNFDDNQYYLFLESLATVKDQQPQQWTGLKDKSGVEIYEGDIVITNESHKVLKADFGRKKRIVQWRQGGGCFDMLHIDYLNEERKIGLTFDNGMVDSIKVIGNIHENPEFLEGE